MSEFQKSTLFWVMILSFVTITIFTILGYFTSITEISENDKKWLGKILFVEFTIAFFAFLYQAFGIKKTENKSNSLESENLPIYNLENIINNLKKDLVDLFVDRNFISHYKEETLLQVASTIIQEISNRKFNNLSTLLTSEIFKILNLKNGCYKKLEIVYEDEVLSNGLVKTKVSRLIKGSFSNKLLKGYLSVNKSHKYNDKEQIYMSNIKVNKETISLEEVEQNYSTNEKEGILKLEFQIQMNKYKEIDSIEFEMICIDDKAQYHSITVGKPTIGLSVEYRYNSNEIKNPKFISKYGEADTDKLEKETSIDKQSYVKYDFGDKLFLPNEFCFISYNIDSKSD